MMNFPSKRAGQVEQQTYFSESEVVVIGWSQFFFKVKGRCTTALSGNIFVSGNILGICPTMKRKKK